jgi:thiamine monophosphate synthase
MEISCTAALRDVELATQARRLVERDSREAQEEQARTIRNALSAGCTAVQLAEATELTTARIYQIRDGVR